VLNERRQIKVKPTLQLQSYPSVFAAGDVIEWDEQKQVAKYAKHAEIVVANVLSLVHGLTPVKEYKGSPEVLIISNGKVRARQFRSIIPILTISFDIFRMAVQDGSAFLVG